ncbi:MAG: murein biosynthesis integral membrane protein MurJ [Chloroflexota bacterium]
MQRGVRAIGAAALVLMAANLIGSVLGFVRQATITHVFGVNPATDSFFAASIVPQMFYDLTVGAAISAALIPTFTEIVDRRGRKQLARTVGAVLGLAWVILLVVTVLLIAGARPLISTILHQNAGHAGGAGVNDTIRILRYLLPSLFFLGTSAVLLSSLYSVRRFMVSAFAPILYHAGIIGGAIFLASPLGILALPVGAVAGSVAQMAVQIPSLLRHIGRPHLRLAFDADVRKIVKLYAPVAAGLTVSLAGQVIDLRFKWQLLGGGLTAMQIATTLTQFPIGIAVAAMSFAILPSISADAVFGRVEQFKQTLATGIRLVLFLTVPAAAGYFVLATPIALIYQHGKVDPQATQWVATALRGYAAQIPFVGVDQLLIFAFYARRNTITPMLIGVVGVGIYIVAALLLMPPFGILGLALANTIQNSLHGIILLGLLLSAIGSLRGSGIVSGLLKTFAAALIMALTAAVSSQVITAVLGGNSPITNAAGILIPTAVGAGVYVSASILLRSWELRTILSVIQFRR